MYLYRGLLCEGPMKRNVMNVENTGSFELSKVYRSTINQTRMPSFFVFFSEEAVA